MNLVPLQAERFPDAVISLSAVRELFVRAGVRDLRVKELAWNHDSKRQIYLTSDLSAFNIFPNQIEDGPPMPPGMAPSEKPMPAGAERLYGHLDFYWLTLDGSLHQATRAKLIYYPQYPEVRLSGFLQGVRAVPSKFLREKSGEEFENRLLFLGTRSSGETIAFLAVGQDRLRNEVRAEQGYERDAGMNVLRLESDGSSGRERLIERLREIHDLGSVTGRRLSAGVVVPSSAPQTVGYTLEALLGVSANGRNEPDFEGYEVKALTVSKFGRESGKRVTVFTPEPDLGVYRDPGVLEFLRRWGYPDRNGRPDRQNFGGIHRAGERHESTELTLTLVGYDPSRPDRIDTSGSASLLTDLNEAAAGWTFRKMAEGWSRKHAAAVYVPAIRERSTGSFRFSPTVLICEGTDLLRVLRAMQSGKLYLDPAIKAEKWSGGSPVIKRRNQFRIRYDDLPGLYAKTDVVTL